jgi:hypothetical protein
LFYAVAGGQTLSIAESAGRFGLSSNWLQPGFVTSFSKFTGSVTGATGSVVSSSPGFADELERDFSLSPGSSAQDRGGVLSPAAANHPVQLEYAAFASWTARPSDAAVDIGAFEVSSEPGATPAPAPSLAILTTELPGATRNKGYTETIAAAGGLRPYTWVIAEGTLPPGLALDGATGVVSGRPTTLGRWGFVVQVQDTSGATSQRALEISVFR